jgi:hypothetical protein
MLNWVIRNSCYPTKRVFMKFLDCADRLMSLHDDTS